VAGKATLEGGVFSLFFFWVSAVFLHVPEGFSSAPSIRTLPPGGLFVFVGKFFFFFPDLRRLPGRVIVPFFLFVFGVGFMVVLFLVCEG